MKPTIGRTVLYVLPHGHNQQGKVRPATVVQNWGADSETPALNLHVILDPANDDPLAGRHQCSVVHDASGETPRSWHWPPREPAPAMQTHPAPVAPDTAPENLSFTGPR